jgi:hypothetical protein
MWNIIGIQFNGSKIMNLYMGYVKSRLHKLLDVSLCCVYMLIYGAREGNGCFVYCVVEAIGLEKLDIC